MEISLSDANADMDKEGRPPIQQTLVIHFMYGLRDLQPLFALGDRLEEAARESGLGVYAGHQIAVDRSDGYLYLYGADADALLRLITPILNGTPFAGGATVKLRYGPPGTGARERAATINP